MPGAMLGACATHMPDALHERTNELTNADLASKTEISGSVGNARDYGSIYMVEWEHFSILKIGVTSGRRWETFTGRGGVLRLLDGPKPGAFAAEARLHAELRSAGWPRAFTCREAAVPFLGKSAAGWTECYLMGESGSHVANLMQRKGA